MKLFLRDGVAKLGSAGDLVDVAEGYARNFLLPRGLAYAASSENERRIRAEAKRRTATELANVESLKDLAVSLNGRSVTIRARATDEQKLFGSVGADQIVEALESEHGARIEPGAVALAEPIREVGVFDVEIRLAADIESAIKVWVVQED